MMNVSALSTPHTPPFDFASFQNNNTVANNKSNSNTTFYHLNDNKVEFRRDSSVMPSPPELMLDSEEDEESVASSSSHSRSSYMSELYHMRHNHNSGRKSAPHRSPSIENHTPFDNSIVFQLDVNSNLNCKSRIINQHYDNHPYHQPLHRINRENQYTIKPVRIQLPKLQHHIVKNSHSVPSWQKKILNDVLEEPVLGIKKPIHHQRKSSTNNNVGRRRSSSNNNSNNVVTTTAPNGTLVVKHASSGRPSRVKGPCQACQETSDGCMRKAFNWPFPTGSQYNDKGKPFVYLCNKCGLRFNKSGGCVCRHCKWVLCKEEKRKAMQLINEMRRSRPDGILDPNEDVVNFACAPKYWSCGKAWKVGWILHSQNDEDDSDTNL